jgi:hypothetical protein
MVFIKFLKKIVLTNLPFLGLIFSAYSQDSTTIKFIEKDFFIYDKSFSNQSLKQDTAQNQLQNYFDRNRIGAIGFPNQHLLLQYRDENLGAIWFNPNYDKQLILSTNKYYLETQKVNTSVFAAVGSKKEQVLKLKHTQQFGKNLFANFKLNRITADNFYQYQKSYVNNVLFSLHKLNPRERIGFKSSISFDRFKHNENGGIKYDSVVAQNIFMNKNLVPVRLTNAKRDYRVLSSEAFMLYRLNKDSSTFNGHYIIVGANGSITKSEFFDNVSTSNYDTTYINNLLTHDSVRFSKFTPELEYNVVIKKGFISIKNQIDVSRFSDIDTSVVYHSQIAGQAFAINLLNNKLHIKEKSEYIWNGFNQGNYKIKLNTDFSFLSLDSKIELEAVAEKRNPDLFFNYFKSNYFFWVNKFAPKQSIFLKANYTSKKFNSEFGITYVQQKNLIFINEKLQPKQINKLNAAFRLTLTNWFRVYKFYFTNAIHFQQQEYVAFALPKWYTQHQLYFQHLIRKNGMIFQIGVQAEFIDYLNAIKYEPALNSFTMNVQEWTEQENALNNIYFVDFFTNLKFKELTFFFKTEHINQGSNGTNFMLMQNYYQRDRALRFGLSWNFID